MAATDYDTRITDKMKEYYGKKIKTAADLENPTCCFSDRPVMRIVRDAIELVHGDISSKYVGCGLIIPEKLEDLKILDLGSGGGRDSFALSKLVGQAGHVTGLDMTDEQIEVARKYINYHMLTFGYDKPNINFVQGYIEKLSEAGLQEKSFDIVVSNCVICLSPDKKAVLSEVYKVLKDGGEMFFSNMYCDRDLSENIRKDEVLWGEGFGGSLCWKDLFKLAEQIGFSTPRLVSCSPISVENEAFQKILGDARFCSATYRLFKLPHGVSSPPQQVVYRGNIEGFENQLDFDFNNHFKTGEVSAVDSELLNILKYSRFCEDFEFQPTSSITPFNVDDPFEVLTAKKCKKGCSSTSG